MATGHTIDFMRGVPADESFPVEQIAECAAAAVRGAHGNEVLQYGTRFGFTPLRRWLADRHGVGEEQVLLTNGSLQLMDLVGWTLLKPGDTVLVEAPTYDRVLTLLRRHLIEVVGIPVQPDGPDVGALEAAARQRQVRLLYTIPDFQNPSGVCATLEKRQRITALAEEHGFWVIEDAPYRHLRYRGAELLSLFELSRKRILHMSSFTKQISPGLRVGYLIGCPSVIARFAKTAGNTYITPSLLGQATVYEFCRRGWLEPQHAHLRELYAPRLEAACAGVGECLPGAHWTQPDGGFFLSLTLPEGVTSATLRACAADKGLRLSDGRDFFPNPADGERFLRLPFCALTCDEIREGVWRLAEAVSQLLRRD